MLRPLGMEEGGWDQCVVYQKKGKSISVVYTGYGQVSCGP